MKKLHLHSLFFLVLLVFSFLSVLGVWQIKRIEATEIFSDGFVSQVEFESIEPYLVNYSDAYVYVTSFGNYTMKKDYANRMSFKYRDESQIITESLFWVNSTYGDKPLSLSKLPKADITVLVANDTVFEFKHPLKSDSGNIVGNLTVTYYFSKDVRPKISIVYENQLLSEWQITWCLLPSMTYLKTTETHAEMLSATTTVSFGVKTFVELGDSASPQNWSLWSLATWEDYGAAIVYGGLEKVLGGKGITVVFPVNETIVDPSIVASASSYAVGPPFQRGLIYSDSGYWFAFYAYSGLKLKTSSDGNTWSSEVAVKSSISFGELFSVWYESGSTIHLVYSDISNKKLNYSQGTISGSSITWSYNYTAVTFSGTDYCDNPTVAVDSNGYPWLTFANRSATVSLCVIKASSTNGSSWGTPVILWSDVQSSSSNVILPLIAGDMYSIAQRDVVDAVYGKRYWASNSSWQTGDGILISDDDTGYWAYSAVAYGTRLYLTTSYATGGSVHVYKYDGSSWSDISPTVASDNGRNVLTINSTSEDIYLSYSYGDKIYLQKRTNITSSWATSEVVCTTTFSGADFRATMRRWNDYVGILWLDSSYNVNFDAYSAPSVSVSITTPTNTTYTSGTIPVEFTASGGTVDQQWFNVKNGSNWVYASNQTYTTATTMTGFVNGTYTFYGAANNTAGSEDEDTVAFTVLVYTVEVTITDPTATTYTSSSIPVEFSAVGGTIDKLWFNCKNATSWIYGSNQTYTITTSMTGFVNGSSYTFYGWANNTLGDEGEATVAFTVLVYTVEVTVSNPTATTYTIDTYNVEFSAVGGTIDKYWFNVKNGTDWVYASNQTYTIATTISGFSDGTYTFYGFANNTLGTEGYTTVSITIAITPTSENPPQTSSSQTVLFKVTLNGKPIENCQIRISTSTYQEYVGTYMTDEMGKATAYLPVGTYDYSATYQEKRLTGTFQHIQEEIIELDLGTGETTQKPIPALDKTQLIKIGIGLIVVVGAVFAITVIAKKRR